MATSEKMINLRKSSSVATINLAWKEMKIILVVNAGLDTKVIYAALARKITSITMGLNAENVCHPQKPSGDH